MRIPLAVLCTCLLLISRDAAAQTRPSSLSTLFSEVFGPNGLVVNSDEQLVDGTTHAAHFNSAFQSDFRLINIALTSQLTALPVPSPASGFIYKFDSTTGTFVRSSRSFGPILADRGETIGRGQVAFGFNYQYFSFDHLDGVPFTAIPAVFRHDDYLSSPGRSDVISTMNTINATVGQTTSALTYGLTDRIDISAALPIISTTLSLLSNATIERVGTAPDVKTHYFIDPLAPDGVHGSTHQFFATGSATGVGDVLVRGKATLMKEGTRALAAGLDVRFPTGDEENLLGSGAYGLRPFAAFSGSYRSLTPHVNVAYQFNGRSLLAGDVTTRRKADLPDQFIYAAGADISVNQRFSVIVDMLGQRILNSPRISTFPFTATGPHPVELEDITFNSTSYWTTYGSVGMKANLAPRLLINFNLRFALNDNGLTDRLTPLIGAEWAF
jgi:hypothetical protein